MIQNSSRKEDIDIIKNVYSGINRNDVDFVLGLMDASVVRIEEFSTTSTYRGHTEFRHNFSSGRSSWAEGSCEPVEFFPVGNKVVVIVHVKVRLKNETKWIDAKTPDVFSLKEGLVTEFYSFDTKKKHLSGLESQANNSSSRKTPVLAKFLYAKLNGTSSS